MADGYLNFDTRIDTNGFQKGVSGLSGGIDSLRSGMRKLAAAAAAAFSVRAVTNFTKECKKLYDVQLEAETKLATSLREHMGASEDQISSIKEYASELQKVGVIGDEIQLSGLQELSTYMESADNLKAMLPVLNDMLAQQYGMNATAESAVSISTMLGKVLDGQTSALSRYGYSFTEAQEQLLKYGTEEQRVATLAQVVSDSVGGMNAALARTNSGRIVQLKNTIGDVKEQFGEAVTQIAVLFVPLLDRVAGALAEIASLAQRCAQAVAELFGASVGSGMSEYTSGIASGISDSVAEQNALTDAVNETAKAQERSLAGFDKINKLSSGSGAASAAEGVPKTVTTTAKVKADTKEADSRLLRSLEELRNKLSSVFQPIKTAWSDYGEPFVGSFRRGLVSLKELAGSIGGSIAAVWTNGTGYQTSSLILQNWTETANIISSAADSAKRAWDENGTGTSIIQGIADIYNDILSHSLNIKKTTSEWFSELDLSPLLTSLDGLVQSVKPLADDVGGALEWLYKEALLPIASWVIEDAGPASVEVLSGAIDVLKESVEALKPLGTWLWEKFLKPVGKWTGGAVTGALKGVASALRAVSDWISENKTLVQDFAIIVGSVGAAFKIAGLISAVSTALASVGGAAGIASAAFGILNISIAPIPLIIGAVIAAGVLLVRHWSEIKQFVSDFVDCVTEDVKELAAKITGFFSDIWEGIKSTFKGIGKWFSDKFTEAYNAVTGAFKGVAKWFSDIFSSAWSGITGAFSSVGKFFTDVWDGIKSCFGSVTTWFRDTFSEAWGKVKSVFSAGGEVFVGIKDGILSSLKAVINGLIDGINKVIAVPFNGIKSALDTIRGIKILKMQPFSGLPTFDVPEIPKLAQGTVVPANYGSFLAVLGDNKREAEVVSPLSTMKKAVRDALSELNGWGGGDIHVHCILDGREIGRVAVKAVAADKARGGTA